MMLDSVRLCFANHWVVDDTSACAFAVVRYDTLRRELDGLLSLKGEKKVAARSRIKEVEKALDELEVLPKYLPTAAIANVIVIQGIIL